MDIYNIVNKIIEYLKGMQSAYKDKDKMLFIEYIEKVFDNTEIIYNDFREILFDAMTQIENETSIEEVIYYLNSRRGKFISTRAKIRADINVKYFENKELRNFYIYVCGVLQGGMHEKVEDRIRRCVMPNENLSEFITRSEEHTIVDLINCCEDRLNNRPPYIYLDNECTLENYYEYERYYLVNMFRHQLSRIDEYWKKLSCEHAKLKYEKFAR